VRRCVAIFVYLGAGPNRSRRRFSIPVFRGEHFVGLLTLENVGDA
jgi:hypothetical protein